MKARSLIVWGFVGVSFLGSVAAQAATLEEIEKSISETYCKMKSYTAKVKTLQDLDMGSGMTSKTNMEATVEWSRKGDKILFRSDMKGTSAQNIAGQETKTDTVAMIVSDGEFMYSVNEQMGQKMAVKMKADPQQLGDSKAVLTSLKEENTVTVLADQKVDGTDCYVVQAVPKTPNPHGMARTLLFFAKDTGINVKLVGIDAKDKAIYTMNTTDIKINPEIKPDRFEFKAPEGVQVMDMSKE